MKIIIMGASSGLGAELASIYVAAGHEVGCAARTVNKIGPCTARAEIDVNDPDAPSRLEELVGHLGGMDLYVHVSGIGYDNAALSPGREAEIATTNCAGFARMVSAAFNLMAASGRPGHIAAISSVAGTKGLRNMEAYCASKRFDWTYLEGLRQRAVTGRIPIAITDIRPGWTRTPLLIEGHRYPLLMSPQRACRLIVKAIGRRRKIAYIDGRWRLLCAAWRLIPAPLWRHLPVSM